MTRWSSKGDDCGARRRPGADGGEMPTRPGLNGFRISPVDAAPRDWPRLAATWALAGETRLFDAGWMSDHLTDASQARNGPSMESMTTLAALASRVPGMWVGVAVASNTFRHPALLAKEAAALDNVTGGRFNWGSAPVGTRANMSSSAFRCRRWPNGSIASKVPSAFWALSSPTRPDDHRA